MIRSIMKLARMTEAQKRIYYMHLRDCQSWEIVKETGSSRQHVAKTITVCNKKLFRIRRLIEADKKLMSAVAKYNFKL